MADDGKAVLAFDSPYFFGASGSTTVWFFWSLLCIVPVLVVLSRKKVEPPPSSAPAGGSTAGGVDARGLPRPDSSGTLMIQTDTTKGPRKQTLVRHAATPEGPEIGGGGGGGGEEEDDEGANAKPGTTRVKSKRTITLETPRARDVAERAESAGAKFHFSNRGSDSE